MVVVLVVVVEEKRGDAMPAGGNASPVAGHRRPPPAAPGLPAACHTSSAAQLLRHVTGDADRGRRACAPTLPCPAAHSPARHTTPGLSFTAHVTAQ